METKEKGGIYFAAMNTSDGFRNMFPEIFGSLSQLYIIKGGPGTGKSRLMREFINEAEKRGYITEKFLCSSDHASLDGVIIPTLSVGIIDGTAPHVYEPQLTGAKDKIIDLGQFLDSDLLSKNVDIIRDITKRKTRAYSAIYLYMKAIESYNLIIKETAEDAFDSKKLEGAVKRAVSNLKKGKKAHHITRIRSAIGENGTVTLNSFAKLANQRYAISDFLGIGGIFLQKLLEETDISGLLATVSYNPIFPSLPDAIYYPESDVSFYIGSESDFSEKQINMKRFVSDKALRPYKPKIRAIIRHRELAFNEMRLEYGSVKRLHSELEGIYTKAMDFYKKEKYTEMLFKSIFK